MKPHGFLTSLLVVLSITNCSSTKNDFRYISYQDLQPSVNTFSPDGITSYSQMLFDVSRNQVIVGAKDVLFRLSLSKFDILESADWKAPRGKRQQCIDKGQSEEYCHNYLKILLSTGRQIFACGTNAFSPQCTWRNIENISAVSEWMDGVAKCPYNPLSNTTGLISENGQYYFGGTSDFSGSDSLISKSIGNTPTLRTKQSDSFWLNDPQFVGSFETDKFIYFLFREAAVEYINCGKIVYPRIARVCKNDSGGHSMLKDNWTTFMKARLNCSISGDYPFYFNEIQSMSYVPEGNIVYATFTTPSNSIAGSAICAFNLTAIDDAFAGPFKFQKNSESAWTQHSHSHTDHFECKSPNQGNYDLREISKYQLMDNAVSSTTLNPLHISELERFTHITIDVLETKLHKFVHVVYVATTEGVIKKITVLPRTQETCIVEMWQAIPDGNVPIINIQFLKETNSVYIIKDNGLMQIPAEHCGRHISRESCMNAMDPYCGWNERGERCSTAPDSDPLNKFWKQSVSSCPILDAPVDGGWSSWTGWFPCVHRTISEYDSQDSCLCQTRQCNNPAPANGGQPCTGASIAVINCTVHGGWSDWSQWSACSATCGTAVKTRSRTCTNPAPAFGGRVCVGQDRTEAFCAEIPPCPAQPQDGRWGPFESWSPCSAPCGGGYRERRRKCNNPPPENGGLPCIGNDTEFQLCNEKECPEQRQVKSTEWVTDYNLTERYHQKKFRITCRANVRSSSQIKITIKEENQICSSHHHCISDDEYPTWNSWSNWSECSVTCGEGIQFRRRSCRGYSCQGIAIQNRTCNREPCEEEDKWGCWTEWSPCNASCNWGVQTRSRTCFGNNCKGSSIEQQPCTLQPCDSLLGWGNWSAWSVCDKNNEQHRKRRCRTINSGSEICQGSSIETRMCIYDTDNDISPMGVQVQEASCVSTAVAFFCFGAIVGLAPVIIYVAYCTFHKKKNTIPSSPHYMTAEQNPYIPVPTREKTSKKQGQTSSNVYTNSPVKSQKFFDYDSFEISTLKRHSNEVKNNGHCKQNNSDNYYYD